jgi:hypothetical protein
MSTPIGFSTIGEEEGKRRRRKRRSVFARADWKAGGWAESTKQPAAALARFVVNGEFDKPIVLRAIVRNAK